MRELFQSIANMIAEYSWRIFYVGITIVILELVFPASHHSMISRARGAVFWMVYIIITATGLAIFAQLWAKLGLTPMFVLHIGDYLKSDDYALQAVGWVVSLSLSMIISDFFYYWFHRLQHANKRLWRFHSVHHSLREMNAWNSNHHFTEEIFRIPFITIPTSLIISPDPGYVPAIVGLVFGFQPLFEHSCTRLHLGPLRYVIGDNRFHRIHHSIEERHLNNNFGSFTTVWDSLFGTSYFPGADEWPDTGLKEIDAPKTLKEFLCRPFNPYQATSSSAVRKKPVEADRKIST